MDSLAPPLARDYDGATEERRGSWAGDFEASRRTSFANAFLEEPPDEYTAKPKTSLGLMHYIPLDEDLDLMGTPPISPVVNRNSKTPVSYFDSTPTHSRNQSRTIISQKRSSVNRDADASDSLFSTMLNKAFETMSRSGEAMDVHGKDVDVLSETRRAAKGKGRAIEVDDVPLGSNHSSEAVSRPTSLREGDTGRSTTNLQRAPLSSVAPANVSVGNDESFDLHPLEASLVSTLEAAEKKVNQFWDWLSGEGTTPQTGNTHKE